jgi:hypothetical protein
MTKDKPEVACRNQQLPPAIYKRQFFKRDIAVWNDPKFRQRTKHKNILLAFYRYLLKSVPDLYEQVLFPSKIRYCRLLILDLDPDRKHLSGSSQSEFCFFQYGKFGC